MENPFLRIKKSNNKLKIGLGILFLIASLSLLFAHQMSTAAQKVQTFYIYKKIFIKEEDPKVKELENELRKKDTELKKLTQTKEVIKEHILSTNDKIPEKTAENYAQTIMKESSKREISPFVQTALLSSESSFRSDPKHALTGVVGMGGIYWNVWKDELRKAGIAQNKEDLKNPIINIRASAYIVSCYMGDCHDIPREALVHYKGYSALGRSQADGVMRVAMNLKRKANNVSVG